MLYILPGLIGRDPWKPFDGANLGLMIELAQGHSSWLTPGAPGLPMLEAGWLPYWLGAIFIWAMPFIDPAIASRIPLGLALGMTLTATWYATYHLARARLARPVAFAFGGEASARGYACALADGSLLALIASLGLAHIGHEFSIHPFAAASVAVLFAAIAKISVAPRDHDLRQAWFVAAIAIACLMASGYPMTAALLVFVSLMGLLLPQNSAFENRAVRQATLSLFVISVFAYFMIPWPSDPLASAAELPAQSWRALKTLIWLGWPVWPLALWALWRWHAQRYSPHIWLPALWLTVLVGVGIASSSPQRHLLLVLPILSSLAVFALPTFKRSALALIDWIALLFFTAVGFVIWFYWAAMQTGNPPQAAAAIGRLLPGFEASFSWFQFGFAMAITAAWMWMIRWRTQGHPHAIWKGLVLSASGTIWVWGLLMSLWLPAINYGMSYEPLARRLQSVTGDANCVYASGISPALMAAMQRQNMSALAISSTPTDTTDCLFWVVGDQAKLASMQLKNWARVATVWQLNNRSERIRIFRRLQL